MREEGKNMIGYQIKSSDGKGRIPEDYFNNRNVLTESVCIKWMKGRESAWKMVPIYEGEIKDPRFINHL